MAVAGRTAILAAGLALLSQPALAHGGEGAALSWSLEPAVTTPLLASALLFAIGWIRLRARSHYGRPLLRRRAMLFGAGWLILAGAVVSPLHAAGETSFAAHMLEHELLMLAAAPLLVLSEPLAVMLWAFPATGRRVIGAGGRLAGVQSAWGVLTDPVFATLVQACALWLWHAPVLFDLALSSAGWHVAQHLSFLVSALLFWTAMVRRAPQAHGAAALCLFVTSVVSGALGALMAFSQSPWYRGYAEMGMAPFGLTGLEDQQLAGLLMWVPGGLVHAGAALAMIAAALKEERPSHAG